MYDLAADLPHRAQGILQRVGRVEQIIHLHLVSRLGMSGGIHLLLPYV